MQEVYIPKFDELYVPNVYDHDGGGVVYRQLLMVGPNEVEFLLVSRQKISRVPPILVSVSYWSRYQASQW